MMELLEALGNLVFWVFFVFAVWKYDVFDKLPYWLQIVIYGSLGVSGLSGLIYRWF
ncbi:hypothetical protein PF617_gp31 [Salmonella phage St162]|uniref:Uncharacterized protein n=1 Tax=Salmonella phage St162 TaxID=2024312 RepID=A0A291AX67_9CAUD|nr:hypothetical protein PF617_gp31 [Salmonella phage St162]ATE85616.1 hypothetical protein St162_gp31 [Salmonella phage St162]